MKRFLFSCMLFLMLVSVIYAQKSEKGEPYSRKLLSIQKSTTALPTLTLKALNIEQLLEDEKNIKDIPAPFGIYTDTLIDLKAVSKTDLIPGEGKIWRYKIENSSAKSIQVLFNRFVIPKGSSLFMYNEDQTVVEGAFTCLNMNPDSSFTLAGLKGSCLILEYNEPLTSEFKGELVIGAIGQAYRDPLTSQSNGFININCPVGAESQLAKHAVCKMQFRTGSFQATCTGALLNNAMQDGTPYFLTANHCISTQTEATSLVVYFNHEVGGCDGDELQAGTLTGSQLLTTGQPSDYTLLLLNSAPESRHQPYYAGWDINDSATAGVTGIHHPNGLPKKLSVDRDSIYSNPVSVNWDDNSTSPINSHWVVGFEEGETSQGSSGSPLFNRNLQVIGQLHGGDAQEAYYGKLAYSYANKPSRFPSIAEYLDPDSTGITRLNGYIPEGNVPDAFFTSAFEKVCVNTPVTFTNYSLFEPYDNSWTITPATYTFVNETSSSSRNPVIEFNDDDEYTVTLDLLVDDEVISTETVQIMAGNQLALKVKNNAEPTICDCDLTAIKLFASGAENYTWIIDDNSIDKIMLTSINGDSTTIVRNPAFVAETVYDLEIKLMGSQGTCSDTLEISYDIIKPENDNIANAILLDYGRSSTYSNICATVEDGEPIPPFTSCTGQLSWCDEYGTGEDIVERSVWFKFVAGTTDRVSISSSPMDNELALYEADSHTEILEGNYALIAANDDRVSTDPRPLIVSAPVTNGQTYWIQVDGSGGGTEDDFYITINAVSAIDDQQMNIADPLVYPVPATETVTLVHPEWNQGMCQVSVYSVTGLCIYKGQQKIIDNQFRLDISLWEPGVYFTTVSAGNKTYTARMIRK